MHFQQWRQYTVTSWQWQPNIDIKIKFWHTCRLLQLNLRMRGEHLTFVFLGSCLTISHTCFPCLSSRWISPGVLYSIMIGLMVVLLTFKADLRWKFYDFIKEIGASNEKSCSWWSVSPACCVLTRTELRRVETEEIVINDCVHVSHGLLKNGGRMVGCWNGIYLIFVGRFKCGKIGVTIERRISL